MAIRCPRCQFDNTSDSKFCKECGTQLPARQDTAFRETRETAKEGAFSGTSFADRYQILEINFRFCSHA